MELTYNWQASLFVLVVTIAVIQIARFVLFKIPAFAETKTDNHEENRQKYKTKRNYPDRIKSSQKVALFTNLFFVIVVLPLIATFESQSIGQILLDIFLILMVYDFFYYLTHRFLFHGKGYFRQVHAVHHQARSPTSLDALLLHPMEAFIGIALFIAVTAGLALAKQDFIHVSALIVTSVIYTQINQINHVKFNLHRFPFKTLNWISDKHAIHHIDMHKGNYATITLLFDKMFGTLD